MMRRRAAVVMLAFCVFFLCGCDSLSLNTTNLLQPPKLVGEQQEIHAALTASVGKNIRLRYPSEGKYHAAIIRYDFDDDGDMEAAVFYQGPDSGSLIRLCILEKTDGVWQSAYEISIGSTQLKSVDIGRVFEAGVPALLISSGDDMNPDGRTLQVFRYKGGTIEECLKTNCYAYTFGSFETGGLPELYLIEKAENGGTVLQCYRSRNFLFGRTRSVRLDPSLAYSKILSGLTAEGARALFIDGKQGTGYTTQVITSEDGTLRNVLFESGTLRSTFRPREIPVMQEENGEGLVLIPTLAALPGYERYKEAERLYLTHWNTFGEAGLSHYQTQLVSTFLGIKVDIPERWIGAVSAKYLYDTNEIKFFQFTDDLKNDENEYLRIRVFSINKQRPDDYLQYTNLFVEGLLEYRMIVSERDGDGLCLTKSEARGLIGAYNAD